MCTVSVDVRTLIRTLSLKLRKRRWHLPIKVELMIRDKSTLEESYKGAENTWNAVKHVDSPKYIELTVFFYLSSTQTFYIVDYLGSSIPSFLFKNNVICWSVTTVKAAASPPVIMDPHMLIIMSADVPMTTPPTKVDFMKRT